MLGNSTNALNFVSVLDVECLTASVVTDIPKLNHSLGVCRDETVKVGEAVDSNQRVFVSIKLHNRGRHIRIPDDNVEFKAATDKNFMLFAVGHLSDCTLMAVDTESLDRGYGRLGVDVFRKGLVLEVTVNGRLHCFSERSVFASLITSLSDSIAAVRLFLTQIPQLNLTVVVARCQLIDVRQVCDALDIVINEPGCVLRSVRNILFALLITGNFLLAATWALHRSLLVWHKVWIAWLQLVIEREEELYVPRKDSTLGAAREE